MKREGGVTMTTVEVLETPQAVAEAAAAALAFDVTAAVRAHGDAVWVAAGGSSAAAAYRVLAESYADAIAWDDVLILIGDERCVPPDHPDSNWGQLAALLLQQISIADSALLRPPAEVGAERAAALYDEELIRRLARSPAGPPRLDHVWLGVGEDGHTLSLFPGHPASEATNGLVAAVHDSPKPPPDRVTLTFEALRGAAHCVILGSGAGKREVLARAIAGDTSLPVARVAEAVEAAGGRVTWILDASAAESLG
jgi:6-phosphogluconolactonase